MTGTPIFEQLAGEYLTPHGRHSWIPEPRTEEMPIVTEPQEPVAQTAGEQDHEDPWVYAGEEADAPQSTPEDQAGVA